MFYLEEEEEEEEEEFIFRKKTKHKDELEVCALCGDADPRRVCRELHFV